MTNLEFVEGVRRIAASNPTYRTGGDGSDGTCDCIGLVMGALGKTFPMHSTNYFARYEVGPLDSVDNWDEAELDVGTLVFKARSASNPRYDLHERYKRGGRYDTGDLTDYYHVGVVTSVAPFVITHCTSSDDINGIDYDNSLTGWTHIAVVADMETDGDEPEEKPAEKTMLVKTIDGNPVKMRKTPSTLWPYIEKIPNGELVTVHEMGSEWATISWGGKRGYMMREFLHEVQEDKPKQNGQTVTISMPMDAAQALKAALELVGL